MSVNKRKAMLGRQKMSHDGDEQVLPHLRGPQENDMKCAMFETSCLKKNHLPET